jgi:hypothetical protein
MEAVQVIKENIKYCPECGEKSYLYRSNGQLIKESFLFYRIYSLYTWYCLKCKHESDTIKIRTI